jgi:allantoate deiminase
MRADRARLERRIGELSRIGGTGTAVTRLGLSREEQQARDLVGSWLAARGARVRRDGAANLIARFGGDGPAVLVGSHLDSVPEGGRFDGALGVLCAVEAVETLLEAGVRLRRPLEIVGWCDEEGARFGIGLFGSLAAFGRLPARAAERRDRDGVSIADALRVLGETGDPTAARRADGSTAAYLELHIEQGPRLERAGIALGVVSSIVGIFHGRLTVRGRQDHAGATVMGERKDALAAASEMVLALEGIAASVEGAVGTVGEIAVRPGAKNVVPGECTFSLDVRAPAQAGLDEVLRRFREEARAIGDRRGVTSTVDPLAQIPVAPLDPAMRDLFARAARAVGVDAPEMVSGAGHDAQNPALAGVPTGMLFVRSTGGSHTPREDCAVEDAALGASALAHAMKELAADS